jgi:hypothetical protein
MDNIKFLLTGVIISVSTYVLTVLFELELYERMDALLHSFEHREIDELFIPFLIFSFFALLHFWSNKKTRDTENEKLKIYLAMVNSTQHILNNFLNQMEFIRLEAEECDEFPKDVLNIYEQIKKDTELQINALSKVQKINDVEIRNSVYPK